MSFSRKIITVGTGTALAQIVTAASTPLLTRLYTPDAYAVWGIYFSLGVILAGICSLRYELAVVLPKDLNKSMALFIGATIFAGIFCLSMVFILFFFGPIFLSEEVLVFLPYIAWFAPLSAFSTSVFYLSLSWFTKISAFRSYSLTQFALPISMVAGQLIFAYFGQRNPIGLILGTVCGQATLAGSLLLFIGSENITRLRNVVQKGYFLGIMREYLRYPVYMTPYTVIGLLRERLAYFAIGRTGEIAVVGYYSLVARLINLPNSLVSSAVRPVFFQHAVSTDPKNLGSEVCLIVRCLGIMGITFWAVGVIHATWICSTLFGSDWAPAGPYAVALSIPAIPLLMINWADRLFDALDRQKTAFILQVIFSATAMLVLIGSIILFKDPLMAVWAQGIVLALYYITQQYTLFRISGYPIASLVCSWVYTTLVGLVAITLFHGLSSTLPPLYSLFFCASFATLFSAIFGFHHWRSWKSSGIGQT